MRTLINLVIFVLIFLCIGFFSPLMAQVSTAEVLKRVIAMVALIEGAKQQVLFIQVDHLDDNEIKSQTYTLSSGSSYGIIAIGDEERIQDIDLTVFDENGNKIGEDADATNIAVVEVRPRWSGKFKFSIDGARMSHGDGFYGLIVHRKD